jgi:antitoxin (DNA-binding transcriptional repressor) of toxin-antitoxin stability system
MKTASVSYTKDHLSAVLDIVRAGQSVTILDRGQPVATLEPIVVRSDQSGRARRLARAGIVRPPTRPDLLQVIAELPEVP